MRIVTLALFAALAAPALAQEPEPDTTAPWLYYPLAVGNEWEYEDYWGAGGPTRFYRGAVTGDTVIGGHTYFVQAHFGASPENAGWTQHGVSLIRYDTATTRVVQLQANGEVPVTCQLGASFWTRVDCADDIPGPDGPEETEVRGG